MIHKRDALAAMAADRFEPPIEQLEALAAPYITRLIQAFFQGREHQDIASARLQAVIFRRASKALFAAIQTAVDAGDAGDEIP